MSGRIEDKRRLLNAEIQAYQSLKDDLLELIRRTPSYFHQLLTHVGNQKVEEFLDKEEKYLRRKSLIEKMTEEIFEQEMRQREVHVEAMNFPDTFRRACLSDTCLLCRDKHNWECIMMLTCGHVFHGHCVKELRKLECPECRREIDYLPNPTAGGTFGGNHIDEEY